MADRRRRRRRASQDSEDEEDSASGSDSASSASPSTTARGREANPRSREPEQPEAPGERSGPKSDEESECESEDGVGEAVLSDYDSADPEENASHSEAGEEEEEEETFTTENTASATAEETKAPPTEKKTENTAPRAQEENCRGEENVKAEEKGNVTGERQSGDGQESTDDPETKSGGKQQLDDDEDRKNPAYIPRKGLFFEHDLRGASQEEERPKGRNRKLWKDEGRWEHDKFREEEQAPKSREELIAIYGYDIRGGGDRRRERRSNNSYNNNRAASPPREKRYRDPERPLRSWQSSAPNRAPPQAPPPQQGLHQSAPSAPRTRAPPPRATRNQNIPPYRNNEPLRPHRERHNQKVALEFTAGGGGVATTRGGRGFRGAAPDDVTVGHVGSDPPQVQTEQKPLPLSDPAPPLTSPPSSANRDGSPGVERPVERKSYSLARRTRSRANELGKQASVEENGPGDKPWATATGEGPAGGPGTGLSDMDQDLARLSLGQNWSQSPTSYIRSEIRGLTTPLHLPPSSQMPSSPMPSSQFPLEEINSNRAKRYSSQRQRSVPEPGPGPGPGPMHLGVMETGHYYDHMPYQGPIYAHGDGPAPLPPQGMLVQPEMHLPHPGLHPHQSGGPITNPALYGAPPVSLSPGQPQQLLPPPFYPPPGVMTFPYPTMYPAPPQAQSQVTYGGVTYYDTVQQQAQPKPSPPRRTSQPVTVKAPPPDLSKAPPPELPYAASE